MAAALAVDPGVLPDARRRLDRRWLGLLVLVLALASLAFLSLAVGSRGSSAAAAWQVLTGYDPTDTEQVVIADLRIPRTALGLLAGGALGLAGALLQGVTRNPLADPGILGVNAGAALCVVVGITVFGVTGTSGYLWFAFAGAAAAALLVHAVAARGRDGATPVKLALAGAAVSAGCVAVTTSVLLVDRATFDQFRFWQVGALANRGLDVVVSVAPFLLGGCAVALLLGRTLNTLALGDDVARGLGADVGLSRALAGAVVVLLCGAATAACGPIGFVGLTIPHLARMLVGPDYRWVLPYSMLLAPGLLLAADVLGRVVARPGEVQVGIVTALIGAPVFIALVRRRRVAGL